LIENNKYAYSTPNHEQYRCEHLVIAQKVMGSRIIGGWE